MTCVSAALTTVLTVGLPLVDQTRPDFSGAWTMDESRSVSATQEAFVGPVTWVVTVTDRAVTIALTRGAKAYTLSYPIVTRRPSGPLDTVPSARAYWIEDRLVTELAQNIQEQTLITREEWSLQSGGRELIVERLVRVEHGYTIRGAQSYNTARDTFVRSAQ